MRQHDHDAVGVFFGRTPPQHHHQKAGLVILEQCKYCICCAGCRVWNARFTIIYNSHITVSNIPAAAYEYVVNGKSAIEWVMERYAVTTHKESGIVNDPNDWAREVGNPRYILDLLLSVIHVSTQTVAIVAGLPRVVGE
jgi:hypothetical protein